MTDTPERFHAAGRVTDFQRVLDLVEAQLGPDPEDGPTPPGALVECLLVAAMHHARFHGYDLPACIAQAAEHFAQEVRDDLAELTHRKSSGWRPPDLTH